MQTLLLNPLAIYLKTLYSTEKDYFVIRRFGAEEVKSKFKKGGL
jgi:hypothetical protein